MSSTTLLDVPLWRLKKLREHLQQAVDLEFWTIPYYMSVMYSIKDPSCEAYRLIQAVVYQEMLHAQLACNIANAFGHSPRFTAPVYQGTKVPHIDFDLDVPNPTLEFTPYSAELGPLDKARINTMCLIEYPEWKTEREPDLREDITDYGSIGEFYQAIRVAITQLRAYINGGVKQVDQFGPFYKDFRAPTITRDGRDGLDQVLPMIDLIVDQGEGQTREVSNIPEGYRNTADGFQDSWPHYRKFQAIRGQSSRPETFRGVADPPAGSPGHRAQQTLIKDFAAFLRTLDELFSGGQPDQFGVQMAKLGGDVLTCWQRGAIPRFS